jgi:predicted oxidoreductase
MQTITLGQSTLESSRLVYGCMRLAGDNSKEARDHGKHALRAALMAGFNHFDHADIYGGGACEELFGEVLRKNPGLREKLIVTSKCGIRLESETDPDRPKHYDFSAAHIRRSVDGSLSRLGSDYLDLLLLHRPDYLFDAREVAETFRLLHDQGKVRHFGVSNFQPSQVELLQTHCPWPLLVNQVEINIHNIESLQNGTLDQCQALGVSPMAWCPLGGVAYPAWENTFSTMDEERIRLEFVFQSEKYGVETWLIMLAWLLRHPARILPIIGSTTPARIEQSAQALNIDYDRGDWYRLLEARNGAAVP